MSPRGDGKAPEADDESVCELVKRIEQRFSRTEPVTCEDVTAAVRGAANVLGGAAEAPPALMAMWEVGGEWHLLQGEDRHYGVFGFNFVSPHRVGDVTIDIFGGVDERADWAAARLAHPRSDGTTCASEGWGCIAAFSEFDYLFCCFDRASPHFGELRKQCSTLFYHVLLSVHTHSPHFGELRKQRCSHRRTLGYFALAFTHTRKRTHACTHTPPPPPPTHTHSHTLTHHTTTTTHARRDHTTRRKQLRR
jgi:hypothetical protein